MVYGVFFDDQPLTIHFVCCVAVASLVLGDLKTDIRDHVYQHSPVVGRILSLSCIIASTDSSVHVNDSAVPRLSALRACASSG